MQALEDLEQSSIFSQKLAQCSPEQRSNLFRLLTPKLTKYIPHLPTPRQAVFLLLDCREAFYGGQAGGGKSDALLMAALQYVDYPKYAALILRRTYSDLALPGALLDRALEWLVNTDAKWNSNEKTWRFPSGATLTFGNLETEKDKFDYRSSEFNFIGYDELTQFTQTQYQYLFSRLRRLKGSNIPIRMRSASNPGDIGHEWVKQRFIVEGKAKGRIFVPARLEDNPYLDAEEYEKSLNELDPVTREQLRHGNWDVRQEGAMFKRDWFTIVDEYPKEAKKIRFWDLAATEAKKSNDPDWTAGAGLAEHNGVYYLFDMRRVRATPMDVENLVTQTAQLDGIATKIFMEQEPGASGVNNIAYYVKVLKGFSFTGVKSTGSKTVRASAFASQAQAGNVKLVRGTWINDFLEEIETFPMGKHDDQTDSASLAFLQLIVKQPQYSVGFASIPKRGSGDDFEFA